ncbi:MAG: hypothetical protein EOP49_30700, partial [Sphingobacteriales bacterium]
MNKRMKTILLLLSIFLTGICQRSAAQIPLLYTDTTVNPGDAITLGTHPLSYQHPMFMDDYFESVTTDIGFPFVFFGDTVTRFLLSSNNIISFDSAMLFHQSHFFYNTAKANGELNRVIMYPYQDLYDTAFVAAVVLRLARLGAPGHRKMIIEVCKTPLYHCYEMQNSSQLILNEGTNEIEMFIAKRDVPCSTALDNGTAIQGLRKNTQEYLVPGRDVPGVPWSVINDGKKFTPGANGTYTIADVPFTPWINIDIDHVSQIMWYDENNNLIGQGASVDVTPGINTHYYTARYTGPAGCGDNYTFSDTVHVQVTDTTTPPQPNSIAGLQATVDRNIFVYPNPANTYITVASRKDVSITGLTLFTAVGSTAGEHQVVNRKK